MGEWKKCDPIEDERRGILHISITPFQKDFLRSRTTLKVSLTVLSKGASKPSKESYVQVLCFIFSLCFKCSSFTVERLCIQMRERPSLHRAWPAGSPSSRHPVRWCSVCAHRVQAARAGDSNHTRHVESSPSRALHYRHIQGAVKLRCLP